MTPGEIKDRLERVLTDLEAVAGEMDVSTVNCECCGSKSWTNPVEFRAKEALDVASNRVAKVLEKLRSGEWRDRQVTLDETPATKLRGDS